MIRIAVLSMLVWGSSAFTTIRTSREEVPSRLFAFTYEVNIKDIPGDARELEMFIPVPASGKHQTITNLKIEAPVDYSLLKNPGYGGRVLHLSSTGQLPGNLHVKLRFQVTRFAVISPQQYDHSAYTKRDTQADELIPLDGLIEQEALKAAQGSGTAEEQTRAFYRHLASTISYDKSGTGWGRGDAVYACTARQGNCTDFHSLFIGMCRTMNIPARFLIGFPLPESEREGKIDGYHCWAEFYLPDKGWVPVDISEASKHPEKRPFFYGKLDANRVHFTTGRDIQLATRKGQRLTLNYFIYPEVLVNGNPYPKVETSFYFKNLR